MPKLPSRAGRPRKEPKEDVVAQSALAQSHYTPKLTASKLYSLDQALKLMEDVRENQPYIGANHEENLLCACLICRVIDHLKAVLA